MRAVVPLLLLLASSGCGALLFPGAPHLYHGRPEAFDEVPPALRSNLVPILYATDRVPGDPDADGAVYGFGRSKSLAFGEAVVRIGPQGLDWDRLVHESVMPGFEGTHEFHRVRVREIGRFQEFAPPFQVAPDGSLFRPDGRETEAAARRDFQAYLGQRLRESKKKELVLFVHGVANGFEDSLHVISAIWHYLGREAVPAVYSWPGGRGGLTGYLYDRESGEFTIPHLKQFLGAVASTPGLERIHVVAHSRGTDIFLSALRELNLLNGGDPARTRAALKLDTIVLAAADLDAEVAGQRLIQERVPEAARRIVVYTAKSDRALGFATWLFGSFMRLGELLDGFLKPAVTDRLVEHPEVQIVDCRVHGFSSSHSYYHSHPAALSDLIQLIRYGRDPGPEHGRPLGREPGTCWILPNDYLKPPASR